VAAACCDDWWRLASLMQLPKTGSTCCKHTRQASLHRSIPKVVARFVICNICVSVSITPRYCSVSYPLFLRGVIKHYVNQNVLIPLDEARGIMFSSCLFVCTCQQHPILFGDTTASSGVRSWSYAQTSLLRFVLDL